MNNNKAEQQALAALEITEAIQNITATRHSEAEIRVLPTMPEFQYRHTCPKCGCHLATRLWIEPDPFEPASKICLHCQHVYESGNAQAV